MSQQPTAGATTYQVALAFEDGVTRFITCAENQTVANASYRQRINIPVDCNDGACGTCKAFCESGEFDGGDYIEDALSDDEAEKGYCLPCQMKPRSDLVLQIQSSSEVAKVTAATYQATVTEVVRYSDSTMGFSISIPNRKDLTFLPGQYVNIHVPGTDAIRSYSFSTHPGDDKLSFLVKIIDGGAMSTWLAERAQVGDTLSFTGPHGSFFLRETLRPVLLLAGGTGLAPILSILRTLEQQGNSRRIHLVYGVTKDEDVVETEELDRLTGSLPQFTWDYCVADKETKAPNQGYVTALIGDEHLAGGDVAVYLCGPPPMVEAVRTHFQQVGVEPTGFYYEKFSGSGTTAAKQSAPAPEAEAPAVAAPVTEAAPAEPGTPATDPAVTTDVAPAAAAATAASTQAPAASQPAAVEDDTTRTIAGQTVFGEREVAPLGAGSTGVFGRPADDDARGIAGQAVLTRREGEATADSTSLLPGGALVGAADARAVAGQPVFTERLDDMQALVARPAEVAGTVGDTTADGYEIGEEHPSIRKSDAIFEAREALELGALELTIGRLSQAQIVVYRELAKATLPHVEGERFVDTSGYIDSNAAFHDFLFNQTKNDHLLSAYQRLGVKGEMDKVLEKATWCHPLCTQDHLDIVDAFEAGDRDRARNLVIAHSHRSKETMRRAMVESERRSRPVGFAPHRFDDLVVVVTGAAQGIGEAVARRISAEGGTVVAADRSDLVVDLAKDLESLGGTAHAVVADLEDYVGAEAVVEAAVQRYSRVDVVVNNVGGAISFKPFEQFTPAQIDAEITRSLMTTLYSCRAALPHLYRQGRGTIVNVSSIATGGIYRVPYAAAKGGINAITRALAVEAAEHGVRVVATAPGGTEAPPRRIARGPAPEGEQEQAWYQAHIDQTLSSSLLGRYGTLDEQAAAICFLASPEAGYITGSVLPVGGGDLG